MKKIDGVSSCTCTIDGSTIIKRPETILYEGTSTSIINITNVVALTSTSVLCLFNTGTAVNMVGVVCTILGDTITKGMDTTLVVSGSLYAEVKKLSSTKVLITCGFVRNKDICLRGLVCMINRYDDNSWFVD